MREKLHRIRLPRNMSFIWKAVVLFIAGIVAIELLYLRHEQQRSAELRDLLTETYSISLELENEIGYGGLIHNFKNYLLRPAEERYYIAALSNAENATTLIDKLEENAQSLGLSLTLTDTRKMITAYRDRLETISSMAEDGDTARDMDNAVRYTDDFALAEINKTMNTVSGVVIDRLTNLAKTSYLQLQVIFALIACGVIYFSVTLNGLIGQATTISYKNKALHKSNADLSRSNLALQQFAGLASHDLKSPVRRIALLADMARQHMKEPQTVEGYILQIRGVAERMNVLVSSLLDFTKTGFRAPRLQHVDVNAILCETISDMSEQIEAKNADIIIRETPDIKADPELIRRVFANLIANSLKYSKPGNAPVVTISSERHAEKVIFSIADNGIGIEARHAEKIFEPMQRLHDHDSEYDGVGIGLPLVKSIIESHGGAIWLDKDYAEGARFCFSVPTDEVDNRELP